MSPLSLPAGIAGAALVGVILWDAFETILVPRRIGRRVRLTRYFYVAAWRAWRALALRTNPPARRESLLGFFGPLSLILLLTLWAAGLIVAFALLEFAAGGAAGSDSLGFATLLYMSGETFFTLGFGDFTPATPLGRVFAVAEAGLGFGFLGTVVGYLPTLYAAFAQREIEISLMDARAGSPPTAAEFLRRTPPAEAGGLCDDVLSAWERWAAQLLETHISYPQLAYYRSQHSNQSWLGSLVTILDSTSLLLARDGAAPNSQARLTYAMARHALVDITQVFVHRPPAAFAERLPPATAARLREALAATPLALPPSSGFESRLAELRLKYEPYAQALASHLMIELPPWIHDTARRDNWQGGPWDRQLAPHREPAHRTDEHF
ncbi:MAG: two pore domain potassium channel family protein [Candidatus Eisenbacteria bacterium]|nr:two pore domain potassium channel family protein [Candidatus Eisenbacteria bacterium]